MLRNNEQLKKIEMDTTEKSMHIFTGPMMVLLDSAVFVTVNLVIID